MKTLEDLERAFENGLDAWQERIFTQEAGHTVGNHAADEVKRLTPVDTGTLRRRWHAKVDKNTGEVVVWVVNNTEYGPYVNYGHRIVYGGKTVGKTKGCYMLEKGIEQYKRLGLRDDIEGMLTRLKEAL